MSELTPTPSAEVNPAKKDWLSRPLLPALKLDVEKGIYLLFILLALISRFTDLGSRVMSHDESLHTQFSYQYYIGDGYSHTPMMHGPSLFHATAIAYWLFGDNDYTSRVPVAILGVLLVSLIPYLLRPWLGQIGALFAAFFFLISPYITYYSRYIRHDIYVIMTALIIFSAILYYFRERKDIYIWWFAIGLGLMFATMETSFIYVAIFGSFMILRLAPQLLTAGWFRAGLNGLRLPILLIFLAVLLAGGGFLGQRVVSSAPITDDIATVTQEGFAADPTAAITHTDAASSELIWRWSQIAGIIVLSVGLFLAIRHLRPHLDQYPEFDFIMLFATLVVPQVSPVLTYIAGWNPVDYSINTCVLAGQESMTAVQLLALRLGSAACWSAFLQSGLVRSLYFLIPTLLASFLAGIWWDRRRWLTAAVIFYAIFTILYTSVFSNPGGWATGMIGSLGYWLEQHGVQRGGQPLFYYLFVTTFYEYVPILFALAAVWLWSKQQRLHQILAYWVTTLLFAYLSYTFTAYLYRRSTSAGEFMFDPALMAQARNLGLIVSLIVLGLAILFWFFIYRHRLAEKHLLGDGVISLFHPALLMGFVPFAAWWMLLSWIIYSWAGEKMPWLSTHLVVPMILLSGWYFNEKLQGWAVRRLGQRPLLTLYALTLALLILLFGIFSQLWLGRVELGSQEVGVLRNLGLFLGLLLTGGIVAYFWWHVYQQNEPEIRRLSLILALFSLLGLLTIRTSYMASFPNADYTTEYMVYAHGAPATKDIVLNQIETLSTRLHGDKSIRVAYDNDSSWPFTWYLREYPNRVYFGENPSNSLNDSPIIIAGSLNWGKIEPYLGNNYEQRTYTFLWWPMEEYRKFSWEALIGNPNDPAPRGLGNVEVRRALWDIFFYRDYAQYAQTFGGTYTAREWPLRHDLRVYTRKDVLANLWDHGVGAVNAESLQDPYAEGALQLAPALILNESSLPGMGPGEFTLPRNVAVGPDGRIYVADSGNHRIQVFDSEANFVTAWGSFGAEPGQFNDPWGLAVDEQFVYVADTWNHRIQKFSLNGALVGSYGFNGAPVGEDRALGLFYGPRDVMLLPGNRLLVSDTGNHRLQVMDREGNFLDSVGQFGNFPGQFNEPVGLAAGLADSVYVVDTWNGRLQQLNDALFPAYEWRVNGWFSQSIDNKPYVVSDSAGRVYVSDPEGYRVLIFTAFGDYLGRFGAFGSGPTQFGLPVGLAIDAQDNLYVVDSHNNRILKFPAIFGPPMGGMGEEPEQDLELEEEIEIEIEEEGQPSPTPEE
jgi:predicted membrane-bound mannosyltransferase/DNA-binding beta-propeller fold protein YncE